MKRRMKFTELPGTNYMLKILLLFGLAIAVSSTTNVDVSTIIIVACIVLSVTMILVPLLFLIAEFNARLSGSKKSLCRKISSGENGRIPGRDYAAKG